MSSATPVWSEFTKIRDGKELHFVIKQLPREKFEDMFELFSGHFMPEEPLHKASHIMKSEESLKEYNFLTKDESEMEKYQVDGCYLLNESGEEKLVGGSIMALERKEDPQVNWNEITSMIKTEEMKNLMKAVIYMVGLCEVRKKYDLDIYFQGRGISVHSDYRKLGLAGEIIKARVKTCKHYGVPMTGAWMTSYGTQISAAKLGWETIHELSFEDFSKASGLKFEGTPPTCKLMVIRV